MKNFTKLILAVVAVFSFTAVVAQPHDLGVTDVSVPNVSGTILGGVDLTVATTFENAGITDIPINDTFSVTLIVDGTVTNDSPITYWFINQPFTAGNTSVVGDHAPVNFTTGTHEICSVIRLHAGDADSTNDTLCANFTVDPNPDIDLSGTSIVAVPDPGNGYDVQGNPSIPELSIDFTNEGTTTIPAGIGINYDVYIGANTQGVVGFLQADLAQNDVTTRTITNSNIIPALPTVVGTFDLCADVNMLSDNDANNDVTCTEYEMIDSFDPNDPANWPIGIEENVLEMSSIYHANDILYVGISNGMDLKQAELVIMNTAGQRVQSEMINLDGRQLFTQQVPMNNAAKGVYIVGIYADNVLVSRKKVVVQ